MTFREALSLIFPRIQEAFPPVTHASVLVDPFTRNSAAFAGAKIRQPSMFLASATDGLNLAAPPSPESMSSNLTDLRSFVMLEGVGHWPQLETPDATNAALVAFLQSLKGHRHD